jgi:ribose transport system substrate-binding protein
MVNIRWIKSRGAAAAVVVTGMSVALGACASDSKNAATGTTKSSVVDEAKANVETWYKNSSAPVDTEGLVANNLSGKRVFYLNGYLTSPSGTAGLEGLEEARDALGFELTTFDGQYSPAKYTEGLQQALTGGYDGVIIYGVDCPGQEQPLKALAKANIPVASISGADCDVADKSAEPLFTADVQYPLGDGKTGNSVDMYRAWGASQADYLIAKTDGTAKVVLFELPDFYVTKAQADGFKDRISECGSCELVETVQILAADLGAPSLTEKVDQALLKNPDANALAVAYDDLLTLGLANSVVQSGRADDLLVVSGVGSEAAIKMIKNNRGDDAGWGYDYAWDHYAAVAALMSAIDKEPSPAVGMPLIWFDKDHNLPDSGPWTPEVDFRSAFEDAWSGK